MSTRNLALSALVLGLAAAVGCDDGVTERHNTRKSFDAGSSYVPVPENDSGSPFDAAQEPGVCDLERCPKPDVGIACCTPDAVCGTDQTGSGAFCVANAGARKKVCKLADCPVPDVGAACCLPSGDCGRDPLGSGALCFANPPPVNIDGGSSTCDVKKCATPDVGIRCCTNSGKCGTDPSGTGLFCAVPKPAVDAGPISTEPPNDKSVDGQCPSYLGVGGVPIWGCCSKFGVCGTFAAKSCLLPAGTQIPVDPYATADDGGTLPAGRCFPPK